MNIYDIVKSVKKAARNVTLATALTLGYAGAAEAETATTAETLVFDDLHSDTRVEVEHSGLEVSLEQITDDGYDDHRTLLGVNTPDMRGFRLRATGVVDYGADTDENGGAAASAFYTIPDTDLRLSLGGGGHFPDMDWIAHGGLGYFGDVFHTQVSLLHHENAEWPVDGRGYASMLLENGFYLGVGKNEELDFFLQIGYVGGPGGVNFWLHNLFDAQDLSSSHSATIEWNATGGRGGYEFYNKFFNNAEGWWDMLGGRWDPTLGWAPMLANYGEYGLQIRFAQDTSGLGGSALFAYNPNNEGNFIEIGGGYRHNFDSDDSATLMFNMGGNLNVLQVIGSLTADVLSGDITGWVYLGGTWRTGE